MSAVMPKRGYNSQEAISYLGVKRRTFEEHFRPQLTPMRAGTSVIYDKFDLDRAFEEYKRRNGRPQEQGGNVWDAQHPVSTGMKPPENGRSIKSTKVIDFDKVSAAILKKRKAG